MGPMGTLDERCGSEIQSNISDRPLGPPDLSRSIAGTSWIRAYIPSYSNLPLAAYPPSTPTPPPPIPLYISLFILQ